MADFFTEIRDDVQEECEKYGTILALKIPRPVGGSRQSAGVGKIFVKYDTSEAATKALRALAGRKFADRTVVTTYFPEVSTRPCFFFVMFWFGFSHGTGKLRRECLVNVEEGLERNGEA